MADFGWAFVKGNLLSGAAPPSGAVQFNDGNNKLGASGDLIFISGSTSQLNLTGTLNVSGAINANSYNVTVTNQNVINLTATGSTKFGDTSDDVHRFTGSLNLAGNLSASVNISASAFYGDGSKLTGIVANPAGANTQIQFNNSGVFAGSSNLTFASNTLAVGGDISASVNVSASAFYGDGSNLSGITTSPAGSDKQIQFNNSNNFGGSSNFVFDSGKVGIGTDVPSQKLTIDTGNIQLTNGYQLQWGDADTAIFGNASSDYVRVKTAGLDRFAIDSSGKVGVGTISPNHKLTVIGDISASINVSASAFYGDGSNLTGIAATLDQVTDNGNTTTNALTASALNLTGLSAGTAANTKFLALDSSNNVVLTSSSGGSGGNIGAAEDGSYADGLFSDFLASTPIGTAIDKFNEILKIIVPGPAPAVDRINYTNTNGIAPKLTFTNQGEAPSGYTDVTSTGSFTSPPAINDQYTVATSGEDFRLGVYNGTQEITGVINFHVTEELKSSQINYTNNAFGNAESGSLKLIVNGSTLHTLNLTTAGAGNPNSGSATSLNTNGSGFFDLSITASAKDQNSSLYDIFQHRTSKYVVDPQDQRKGWNIAKIEHQYGSTTYVTNFVQWFNDTDSSAQAMSVSNNTVTFTGKGSKYLSGVQYFRSASLVYNADVANVYKFTYPTGNVVTFNRSSNIDAISAQSLPATDTTDFFNKVLRLTASTDTNDNTMLNDSSTISLNLSHPFKSNLSAAGSVTTSGILIYNVDTANNNLTENFDLEDFRITNGSYATQTSVTTTAATWSSSNHMTLAAGHTDGLLMYNGALRSPLQGANGGNFSTLANGPVGNPNYSSVEGTRTFFRKIQNTTGSPVRDLKITSTKSTRIDDETLAANNVRFSIKIPETTGWMDISQNFSYGNITDDDGALISSATDNSETSEASTNSSVHCITFGTASVAHNHYVVIKIQADESWTGNFDKLQFQLGASDFSAPTEAPALDDIDLDDNAGETAKLSFGTSNAVAGYTNVAGGVGSMPAVNSNGAYTDNEDTNRGVFKIAEVMGGTLNEDVSESTAGSFFNFENNTFKNAYTGSLLLIVNDSTASTLSLANLNATNNLSSDTGFSVGAVSFSTTNDGVPDYTKTYRNGTYSIGTSLQRSGWNYARVIHRIGASDTTTNHVQWVVDPSGNVDNTAVTTPTISNFNHPTTYYQSGIGYFASNPSGTFDFEGSNFYNNVYQSGSAISFPTTTNCSVSNIRIVGTGVTTFDSAVSSCDMPALNNSADCETTSISVTGTMLYNGATPSISGGLGLFTAQDVTVTGKILHPHKSDKTTNSASKTAFMIHSGTLGSTNLNTNEYFGLETYRIVSGNYANQASVTNGSNAWNPQTHMNAANAHGDGMVTINNKAISPLKIGNDGDTRNVAQGGSLQAPTGNPDYSTLSENVRTYYRYFRNETGLSKPTFTITLYGDANLVAKSGAFYTGALGANKNINVELKVPSDPAFTGLDDTSTAWADCVKPFGAGTQPNVDGVGIFNGGGSDLNQTVGSGGRAIALQLQEKQVRDDQYFVVKISAHKDWTGYLSRIEITY